MCRIITTCATSGVGKFKLGGLELKFENPPETIPFEAPEKIEREFLIPVPDHEKNEKEAVELDEIRMKEEQVAMLILEDPAEFERQLVSGELEDMIEDAGEEYQG